MIFRGFRRIKTPLLLYKTLRQLFTTHYLLFREDTERFGAQAGAPLGHALDPTMHHRRRAAGDPSLPFEVRLVDTIGKRNAKTISFERGASYGKGGQ